MMMMMMMMMMIGSRLRARHILAAQTFRPNYAYEDKFSTAICNCKQWRRQFVVMR